ncbi:AraC family transcriptional regulator [Paenibacillus arenilitoris]|uniref:Helix-turn-helix transcriptional regulator n=1 Tax=Paenibacillus arenilitoris TaxID=2772299 RepID=A0A927CK62_9BACL|nr:AraC family transcriptional regulator [Paenibacillus arenilitoris]MBD2868965.1 helix-turn-helix transcriptional regulator [Paenibacillus arenilitoris]
MSLWPPLDNRFQPVVHYANRLACRPGERFGPRLISDCQFLFVSAGTGKIQVCGQTYKASPGCLFYYGPRQPHLIEASEVNPFVLYGLHFTPQGVLEEHPPPEPPPIVPYRPGMEMENEACDSGQPFPFIQQTGMWPLVFFEAAVKEYRNRAPMAPLMLRGLFMQFIVKLSAWVRERQLPASALERHIAAIKDLLDRKAGEPYHSNWIQLSTPYSHDYMARLFRDRFGVSPHMYHTERRIGMARKLLEGTGMTVTEISERLQFQSVHYFSKWFKRSTGEQPTQYRMRMRMI